MSSQAGTSSGSSGSSSSSGDGNSSSGGGVVNTTSTPSTTMTLGSNRSGTTPEVIGTPSKLSKALDVSAVIALSTNPAIIGVVILLVSIVIAAPHFKKK